MESLSPKNDNNQKVFIDGVLSKSKLEVKPMKEQIRSKQKISFSASVTTNSNNNNN